MQSIGLYSADKNSYPNLALMKLSAYHKAKGDVVSWYVPLEKYDKIYSSKVFTYSHENDYLPKGTKKGGTGYQAFKTLPNEIEHIKPDYTLYGIDYSLGFLTRGCPNNCQWCIVPKKEGNIRSNADIKEFLQHDKAVLMDNNVLACNHGIKQLEKISNLGIKVDFNQGLDARLIDDSIAKLLSKVKWLHPVRLACDTSSQMPIIQKAVTLLRWHNVTPSKYFIYVLVKSIDDAIERIKFLKGLSLDPFAQPYREYQNNTEPTKEQKNFARWVNHKAVFKSVKWDDYRKTIPNKSL